MFPCSLVFFLILMRSKEQGASRLVGPSETPFQLRTLWMRKAGIATEQDYSLGPHGR